MSTIAYYVIVDNGDGSASARFFEDIVEATKYDASLLKTMGTESLSEGVVKLEESDIEEEYVPEEVDEEEESADDPDEL